MECEDILACTFLALRPIERPTSSRIAVVGKRDCVESKKE